MIYPRRIEIKWITHPRHLPPAQDKYSIVLDVAFASTMSQFEKKTAPLINKLGSKLLAWVDHHNHPYAWPLFKEDERFKLIPNKEAHACPELITKEFIEARESNHQTELIYAHADFDGAVSALKWMLGGEEPWLGADEDSRAADSPGRGAKYSDLGHLYSRALDQISAVSTREERVLFLDEFVEHIFNKYCEEKEEVYQKWFEEIKESAILAEKSERRAGLIADEHGRIEGKGVFVVRLAEKQSNQMCKNILVESEKRAEIGVLYEPDLQGGHLMTAATFNENLDLSDVSKFKGGRSDYRFARASKGGHDLVKSLSKLVKAL